MKPIMILFVSLILLSMRVSGQAPDLKYIDSEIKRNYSLPEIQPVHSLKDDKFFIKRYIEFPTLRDTGWILVNQDGSLQHYPKVRRYNNYQIAERFPGSSKYYAKNPGLIHSPDSVYFIVKPDTISKYYLIIKDPGKPNE
jgi:hypothetical protein